MKPANHKENRRDRRLLQNQTGKRRCVVVVRERDGQTLPAAFRSEAEALSFIRYRVAKGTEISADESAMGYAARALRDEADQSPACLQHGRGCTNAAESFFSRMRRAEIGHHHHLAGTYLARYAQEAAWREDHRR